MIAGLISLSKGIMSPSDLLKAKGRFPLSKSTLARNLDNSPVEATTTVESKLKSSPRKKCSELERKFSVLWNRLGGPELEAEFKFHPARKWRFDFVHHQSKIAVEIEGGQFCQGRHQRPLGFEMDCEKYNAAIMLGWRVFRLTGKMITSDNLTEIMSLMQR